MKTKLLIAALLFIGIVSNIFPDKVDFLNYLAFCGGVHTSTSSVVDKNGKIFENPPYTIPKIFAKNVISISNRYEYGVTISPNWWDELFFTSEQPNGLVVMRKLADGNWTNY